MTQADSAPALRMSLDSRPTHGQGQAAEITATTPLPDGWGSFCSKPDEKYAAHWYATAPWPVNMIKQSVSDGVRDVANKLCQTVDAETWPELHAAVAAQQALYELLREAEAV